MWDPQPQPLFLPSILACLPGWLPACSVCPFPRAVQCWLSGDWAEQWWRREEKRTGLHVMAYIGSSPVSLAGWHHVRWQCICVVYAVSEIEKQRKRLGANNYYRSQPGSQHWQDLTCTNYLKAADCGVRDMRIHLSKGLRTMFVCHCACSIAKSTQWCLQWNSHTLSILRTHEAMMLQNSIQCTWMAWSLIAGYMICTWQ